MIETREPTFKGGLLGPLYYCTECGAEAEVGRVEKDSPHWHNYDCSIQREIREAEALLNKFLKVEEDLPLIHFTVIDPREMGYSENPEEVNNLIDAMAEAITAKLREER